MVQAIINIKEHTNRILPKQNINMKFSNQNSDLNILKKATKISKQKHADVGSVEKLKDRLSL